MSVKRKIALSVASKSFSSLREPGSRSAAICSSVRPRRFPEAECERVQYVQLLRIDVRRYASSFSFGDSLESSAQSAPLSWL